MGQITVNVTLFADLRRFLPRGAEGPQRYTVAPDATVADLLAVMRASYLLAPTGGDHMRQTSNRNGLRNQVGLCHFLAYEDDQALAILKAVTAWDATPEELVATAHRGLTLARLFNLREGFGRDSDRLPARFTDPLPKHAGLTREAQDKIVTDYYVEQGWDPVSGVPTAETIGALQVEEDAAAARR
jgi:aldehyde:ferredoxin oxidoreductase